MSNEPHINSSLFYLPHGRPFLQPWPVAISALGSRYCSLGQGCIDQSPARADVDLPSCFQKGQLKVENSLHTLDLYTQNTNRPATQTHTQHTVIQPVFLFRVVFFLALPQLAVIPVPWPWYFYHGPAGVCAESRPWYFYHLARPTRSSSMVVYLRHAGRPSMNGNFRCSWGSWV